MNPRAAKESLFTGVRMTAQRTQELGMVNHAVARSQLLEGTLGIADQVSAMPSFGLALAKKAVNQAEDLQGMRAGMGSVFGQHHFAHAHNAAVSTEALRLRLNARDMARGAR